MKNDKISSIIDTLFSEMTKDFLGFNPKNKRISKQNNNLVKLFLTGLGSENINTEERNILKTILSSTYDYVDSIRSKTKARINSRLSGLENDYKKRETPISSNKIRAIIGEELSTAGSSMLLTVNSEATKIRNISTAMKIEKIANSKGESDPYVFFIVTLDERTAREPEKTLHIIKGTTIPRVWRLSEITGGHYKKGDKTPAMLPHPNCFIGHQNIKIFTENSGYKNIKDIKIGERVLTHTGKFKKVLGNLEVLEKNKYKGDIVEIEYMSMGSRGEQKHKLKVTPDHEFKTNRGWVQAKNLKNTDKFLELHIKCGSCDALVKPRPKVLKKGRVENLDGYFCSQKCSTKYQWKNEKHKINVSKKASKQMKKEWKNPTIELISRLEKAQKRTMELIENNQFWTQLVENKEIMQKNVAKINSRFQKNKPSKEERKVFNLAKSVWPDAESNKVITKFCVDIVLEDKKTIIEYDGGGHYLPVYCKKMTMKQFMSRQKGRDTYLNNAGYHIIRYSEIPTKEKMIEDVQRVSSNSQENYTFKEIDILNIKLLKNKKTKSALYDLKIEDDESFIVNGIVSHNCRCVLTYLATGWGFDDKGKIKYKGINHNEQAYQKEKYKLP